VATQTLMRVDLHLVFETNSMLF